MRQRVSLARTLASEPKILLMDEPFAALDEQTRLLLGDKVLQIQQQLKQTTLLITHNITEAVQMSDRILVMTYRPGKVKRIVDIDLPRPRTSDIVGSEAFGRYVAQIWSDLARGSQPRHARRRENRTCWTRRSVMTMAAAADPARSRLLRPPDRRPRLDGAVSSSLMEPTWCIRIGWLSRFIVPPPSRNRSPASAASSSRSTSFHRFLLTPPANASPPA